MNLYEHEGKELLLQNGIAIPRGYLVRDGDPLPKLPFPIVCKVQVLSGNRMKDGGIVFPKNEMEISACVQMLFQKEISGLPIESVLIEEKISYESPEYYISFSCDTGTGGITFMISSEGGTGVEGRRTTTATIDPEDPRLPDGPVPQPILQKIFDAFRSNDCLLLEINPLVFRADTKEWVALDAKVILDDSAFARHPLFSYNERSHSPLRKNSEREISARKIDEGDHRGTAGSAYFDLDGDIAMLPSGGGASLTAMDALYAAGGAPANYTEYSGNPSAEKVKKLVAIVVSKENLSALWVVGAVANFTDIYETMNGLLDGLRSARDELGIALDFPIVVRRGGPREKEAFALLSEAKDFHFVVCGEETSIEESARQVVSLSNEYKNEHEKRKNSAR